MDDINIFREDIQKSFINFLASESFAPSQKIDLSLSYNQIYDMGISYIKEVLNTEIVSKWRVHENKRSLNYMIAVLNTKIVDITPRPVVVQHYVRIIGIYIGVWGSTFVYPYIHKFTTLKNSKPQMKCYSSFYNRNIPLELYPDTLLTKL